MFQRRDECRWQHFRYLNVAQFAADKFASDAELHQIHHAIVVGISEGPTKKTRAIMSHHIIAVESLMKTITFIHSNVITKTANQLTRSDPAPKAASPT